MKRRNSLLNDWESTGETSGSDGVIADGRRCAEIISIVFCRVFPIALDGIESVVESGLIAEERAVEITDDVGLEHHRSAARCTLIVVVCTGIVGITEDVIDDKLTHVH